MHKDKTKRFMAAFFTLSLMLSFFIPLSALSACAENGLVEVSTAKQLQELSKKCSVESYSENLVVSLLNDIDLKGADFSPIPVFHGVFDGQGHEIRGLEVSEERSGAGFFRIVGESAVIKRLHLSGTVKTGKDSAVVGLLSAENFGRIEDCSVSGELSGFSDLGAIAGINHSGASILGCSSEASVNGALRVGGIAGKNLGGIEKSKNLGFVNTAFEAEIPPVDFSGADDNAARQADSFSDVGGICGLNLGTLRESENKAKIGNELYGKNIGGIAGSHKGLIVLCKNSGSVSGSVNVGGVAGFFMPEFALSYGGEGGASLDAELETLNLILQNLSDALLSAPSFRGDAGDISDAAVNIDFALDSHLGAADEELSSLVGSLGGFFRDISAGTQRLSALCSDFSALSADEISQIRENLQTISPAALDAGLSEDLEYTQTELSSIERQISALSDASEKLKELSSGFDDSFGNETLTELQKKDSVAALLGSYYETAGENVLLSDAVSNISASFSVINRSVNALNTALSDSAPETNTALSGLTAAMARFQRSFTDFSLAAENENEVIFSGIGKTDHALKRYLSVTETRLLLTFNEIYGVLGLIQASLSEISSRLPDGQYEISALMDSAAIQLDLIGTLALSMLPEAEFSVLEAFGSPELTEKPGQISSSRNSGDISAFQNAGGIAGLMAMSDTPGDSGEYPLYLWSEKPSLFRAVLMTSENRGDISVQESSAGGIVGRCETGLVYKSDSEADIISEKGSYCGGIAGASRTSILESCALGTLSGNDYLGGIAGEGQSMVNCRSMVLIKGKGENLGSVAGNAYGEIVGNAFVDEGLGGIKDVNFAGRAYPLPYESFIALEGLPSMFTQLHAGFYVDGELLKSVTFEYDGSIPSWQIPKLSEREEGFGQWEYFKSSNLIRSFKVNAVYSPWLESVSSGGDRPLLIAEGKFTNEAYVSIEEERSPIYAGKAYRAISAFTYRIEDEYGGEGAMYRLRLLCETPRSAVLTLIHEGEETKVKPSRSGEYLIFTAPAEAEIIVLEPIAGRLVAVGFIILSVLVALGFFWYSQKRLSRPQSKAKK